MHKFVSYFYSQHKRPYALAEQHSQKEIREMWGFSSCKNNCLL